MGFQAEFKPDGRLRAGIPPHRSDKDISIPADIVEEVLRIYGYDKIEPRMPPVALGRISKPVNPSGSRYLDSRL